MQVAKERLKELKEDLMMQAEEYIPTAFVDEDVHVGLFTIVEEGRVMEWHCHEDSHEYFVVLSGRLTIEYRNREPQALDRMDMGLIKCGIEHRTVFTDTPTKVVFLTVPPEVAYVE